MNSKNTPVISRNGKEIGRTLGSAHACRMDGCAGVRLAVRWLDGRLTYPCTKGMSYNKGEWRIE